MKSARSINGAFTLIELMLVVAILGIALTMGYPAISSALHRQPMTQAVMDITEGCRKARAHAILTDTTSEFRIYSDGRMEVADAPPDVAATLDSPPGSNPAPAKPVIVTDNDLAAKPSSPFSGHLSDSVAIELIDVNFAEFKDQDVARVKFYPNGTSDEFTVILFSASNGERRKITLECVTALAEVSAL
jgi:prepilin-type N-terminal cleavage/methylation domain-containing protein